MSTPSALVQKLWNYCNILRHDGLSYGDNVEHVTFLLFLKVTGMRARRFPFWKRVLPRKYTAGHFASWPLPSSPLAIVCMLLHLRNRRASDLEI
jgi:type I restriction enzyme M protein